MVNKGNGKLGFKELMRHFCKTGTKSRGLIRAVAYSQTGNA